jgi:hypothetical protein
LPVCRLECTAAALESRREHFAKAAGNLPAQATAAWKPQIQVPLALWCSSSISLLFTVYKAKVGFHSDSVPMPASIIGDRDVEFNLAARADKSK